MFFVTWENPQPPGVPIIQVQGPGPALFSGAALGAASGGIHVPYGCFLKRGEFPPKWMVKIMESCTKMDIWVKTHFFGENLHIPIS